MSKTLIHVEHAGKNFVIPNEHISSIRGHFVNIFKKKSYETFHALSDVSFDVQEGDFFGIIGRNGSGKSTLLKLIAQIYEPSEGKISIHGKISPFLELGVGFNPELSARENIYLNGAILGMQKKQIDAIYDEVIEFSELEQFQNVKLKHFSSGMYVRLAFTVAIQAQSDILLMDEVLAVGDQRFQEKCFQVFENLKAQGKTIVFVSHDMGNIQKFCNKAIVIEKGKIVYQGNPQEAAEYYHRLNHI